MYRIREYDRYCIVATKIRTYEDATPRKMRNTYAYVSRMDLFVSTVPVRTYRIVFSFKQKRNAIFFNKKKHYGRNELQ